jgi:hypothetical protein
MSEGSGYAWALVRAVPRVHLGDATTVGVIVHARQARFLELRALTDPDELGRRCPEVDARRLARYLGALCSLAAGDERAGPLALLPPSERFHWLVAPRSDVIQFSPVHEGVGEPPARALERIWRECVARPVARG